jgi:hypothetical protein
MIKSAEQNTKDIFTISKSLVDGLKKSKSISTKKI